MLVDQMGYQGQQGSGGPQNDAFHELLFSTGLADVKKQQQHQMQHHFDQQNQQQQQQQFEPRSEESLPNYDFQSTSSSYGGVVDNGEDMHKSPSATPVIEPSHPSHFPSYPTGSSYPNTRQHLPIPSFVESSPSIQEKGNAEAATVAAVEQTVKKCVEDLMRMMESMAGRIGQLESSTRRLEQMVTDFKGGSEKSQGVSSGKLVLIESMLSEVQRGVQELRNKQEVMDVQSTMGKLQSGDEGVTSSVHPQSSLEPLPAQSPRAHQMPETPPYPLGPSHHAPHQPLGHIPPFMVPPQLVGLAPPPPPPPAPEPHYQAPQQGPPPPPPQQSYHSQQQQQQQQGPPPSAHPHGPFPQPPELPPYGATPQGPYKGQSGSFGQDGPLPPYGGRPHQMPQTGPGGSQMYDQSGGPPPYQSQGRVAAPAYDQPMGIPPPGYFNPGYRSGQQTPSAPSSGAGGYPRLPTAQPVQHALPTAREREGVQSASGATPLSTNRLSIDEVIDKVAVMGFSKDQVRAVVRRLTENGQSVDLNIVLDKLMHGEGGQPPKGWFQRG